MPDVKVRVPHDLFDRVTEEHREEIRSVFIEMVAAAVAHHLSCLDYNNEDMALEPSHIDVHLITYDQRDVWMHGAPVLIEITGYDYPTRMEDIRERLAAIRHAVASFMVNRAFYRREGKQASVSYVPIPDGCWV